MSKALLLPILKTIKMPNSRRNFLVKLSLGFAALMPWKRKSYAAASHKNKPMNSPNNPIISIKPLGFQWETADPFLFCVHHDDQFPRGEAHLGPPSADLKGRHIGQDFILKDGWRMYHGKTVPGFPGHPHRGFETITVVRKGIVDHADSLGGAGRYGEGDVQWMTAGKGLQHSEMFPLLHQDKENPMELFQIWLNLPQKSKMVHPHFKMLWAENIPVHQTNKGVSIEIIAGNLGQLQADSPPPNSWAAEASNEVAVWNIMLEPNSSFVLPAASAGLNRSLYFYEGEQVMMAQKSIAAYHAVVVESDQDILIESQHQRVKVLLLQGRPINEPVVQHGPFVMNSREEIQQAFQDYHQTQFGGWPWPSYDQVHDAAKPRFALHADGRIEKG